MHLASRTLLDSAHAYDAGVMGFDGPCDPVEDGEGLIVRQTRDGWFVLNGPDGEINLSPAMAKQVVSVLGTAIVRSRAA